MKKEEIKYILIDFGGTFFTYGSQIAISKFAKILGISEKKIKLVLKQNPGSLSLAYRIGKVNGKTFWNYIKKELMIDSKMAEKLEYVWHSSFKPNKGMKDIVKKLRKKYKVFVISGNISERVKYLNKKYLLKNLFDGFFFSFDCGVTKPDPEFLKIALKKLKANPRQCLLIDDSKKFNKVAKKLGMNGIVFQNADQLKSDLNKFI